MARWHSLTGNLYGYDRADGKARKSSAADLRSRDSIFGTPACWHAGCSREDLTIGHIVPYTYHSLAGLNAPVNDDRSRNDTERTVRELVSLTYKGLAVGIPQDLARAIVTDSTEVPAHIWAAAGIKSQKIAVNQPRIHRYSAQFDLNNLVHECMSHNKGANKYRLPHNVELELIAMARYRTLKWYGLI